MIGVIYIKVYLNSGNINKNSLQRHFPVIQNIADKGTKDLIERFLNQKQDSLKISKEALLKNQVRNLKQAPKVENNNDSNAMSRFFDMAANIYTDAQGLLERGIKCTEVLLDSNATEQDKDLAKFNLKSIKDFLDISGRILNALYNVYNSGTSGGLEKIINQISGELVNNGTKQNDFSIDSLFNFSCESLNIDKLSFDNPEALHDAFNKALNNIKNNKVFLENVSRIMRERYSNDNEKESRNNLKDIDIFI